MKLLGKLIEYLFMNRKHPRYSRILFKFCSRYVNFCYGDNNFDRVTNGEHRLLREIIPHSDVIFDIGANTGSYSQDILDIKKVSIHAFEPDPRAFEKLKEKSVRANDCAIGKEPGRMTLNLHKNKTVLNSLLNIHSDADLSSKAEVKIDTVDNYAEANNVNRIDFMKIDVEGYEFFVLQGAREMLRRKAVDFIQFEFSGATVSSRAFLKDFIDFFTDLGYTLYRIKPFSIEKVIYFPDQERFTLTNYIAIRNGASTGHMKMTNPFYH